MPEPLKRKILRIGVIQGGRIVEEKLVRKRASVTIGTGVKNTIALAASNIPKSYTLFEMRGNEYYLAFDDNMSGRVSINNQAADLQSLKAQNLVKKTGNLYHLKLNEASRGRVSVGNCIILFQFVNQPPEPVKPMLPASVKGYWSRNIDWPYTSILSVVATSFLLIIAIAKNTPLPKEADSLDDIPNRFLKMVAPDWDPSQEDKLKDNGSGKEKQPLKSERKKPKKTQVEEPLEVESKGDDQVAAAQAARRRASMEKRVSGRGLLKILGSKGPGGMAGGAAVADVFSEGSIGGSDGAFDGISGGVDIATSRGARGSRGAGGAGTQASIKNLGTKGVVGGAGRGGRGKKEARVTGRVSSAAMEEFDSDSRSQADIKKVMRRRIGGIKRCYEKKLKRNPELRGKVVIRFVIHPGGRVIEVEVVENTTGDSDLAACIRSKVKAIRFGSANGGETVVVYPFILAPGG
jgi:hypothetical protein